MRRHRLNPEEQFQFSENRNQRLSQKESEQLGKLRKDVNALIKTQKSWEPPISHLQAKENLLELKTKAEKTKKYLDFEPQNFDQVA